jgi:hypothetical protein
MMMSSSSRSGDMSGPMRSRGNGNGGLQFKSNNMMALHAAPQVAMAMAVEDDAEMVQDDGAFDSMADAESVASGAQERSGEAGAGAAQEAVTVIRTNFQAAPLFVGSVVLNSDGRAR